MEQAGILPNRRDPLALDLDNSGDIETISANEGILFDHGADGIKTGTGWINPNDGWLALDLNDNGEIDSGRELFGDNTLKLNGNRATDAFDALASFDTNHDGKVDQADATGDADNSGSINGSETFWDLNHNGVFDAGDKKFTDLRVWVDANSNGETDTGELKTLASLGIVSIGTGKTVVNTTDANGNVIKASGSFAVDTNNDGTADATRTTQAFDLTENKYFREFTANIPDTTAVQDLPDMQGSGAVRDLQEAMSLGTAASTTLKNTVEAFVAADTRAEQYALIDKLLLDWANTSDFKDFVERIADMETRTDVAIGSDRVLKNYEFRFTTADFDAHKTQVNSDGKVTGTFTGNVETGIGIGDWDYAFTYGADQLYVNSAAFEGNARADNLQALAKIRVLEVFNNSQFFDFSGTSTTRDTNNDGTPDANDFTLTAKTNNSTKPTTYTSSSQLPISYIGITEKDLTIPNSEYINAAYDQMRESIFSALMLQTRLKPYLEAIDITLSAEGDIGFDFSGLDTAINSKLASDPVNGMLDAIDLLRARGGELAAQGWNAEAVFTALDNTMTALTAAQRDELTEAGYEWGYNVAPGGMSNDGWGNEHDSKLIFLADAPAGESNPLSLENISSVAIGGEGIDNIAGFALGNDVMFGGGGADHLTGHDGNDYMWGGAGNDSLHDRAGDDYMFGGAGDDYLHSSSSFDTGNDWLSGGDGNDHLYDGNGSDVLDGGTGDDIIRFDNSGEAGDVDTVLFGYGDGDDEITVTSKIAGHSITLQLKSGVRVDDVLLRRGSTTAVNNLLTLELAGAGGTVSDSVQINNFFTSVGGASGVATSPNTIDAIRFADGTVWETSTLNGLKDKTLTLSRNAAEDSLVFISAADLLGNSLSDAEKARWQLVSAERNDNNFGIDTHDIDADGNTTEVAFWFAEDLFGSGVNYVAFLPKNTTSNMSTSFNYVLQRDDGLRFASNMAVGTIIGNTLTGTAGDDIIDADQRNVAITINAGAGNDLLRDGNKDDVLHGDDGDDILTYNWGGNGNDQYYGDAGNDVLDAGWSDVGGFDLMVGGSGNDLYVENNLWSGDRTVIDNSTAALNDVDTLVIGNDGGMTDYHALWFAQDANDLLITQIDQLAETAGYIRVEDWFAGNSEAKLDRVRLTQSGSGDVYTLAASGVDTLVQAMAGFTQPADLASISTVIRDEQDSTWQLLSASA